MAKVSLESRPTLQRSSGASAASPNSRSRPSASVRTRYPRIRTCSRSMSTNISKALRSSSLRPYGFWLSFASLTAASAGVPSRMYAMPKRKSSATANSNTRWGSRAGSSTMTGTHFHITRQPIPSRKNNPMGRRHTLSRNTTQSFRNGNRLTSLNPMCLT